MIRLHFVVEGQSEETFVKEILAPELGDRSTIVDVHRITTGRKKGKVYRGGFVKYEHLRNDLDLWMKQERQSSDARFTTMVDLYGLPSDFPGKNNCEKISDPFERVERLESEFGKDLDNSRLIPHIQLHEFESLLFSDPAAFSSAFPTGDDGIQELSRIRETFASPEHINDGPNTAPSKLICKLFPGYVKTSYGLTIAKEIGIKKMRAKCKHFDNWIKTLLLLE